MHTTLLQCCVGIVYSEATMLSASGRTATKKWCGRDMANSIGSGNLVSAAKIMTKHKPTEEESMLMEEAAKKGEPAPTKRKTTTEAVQFKPVILITPSDEHALAYVQKYPNAI